MGTIDRQPGSGKPRCVRINENTENVEKTCTQSKRTDRFVRYRVKLAFIDYDTIRYDRRV